MSEEELCLGVVLECIEQELGVGINGVVLVQSAYQTSVAIEYVGDDC